MTAARSESRTPASWTALVFLGLSAALLVSALFLGGATREGALLNAVVRLISLPTLFLGLWRLYRVGWTQELAAPMALLAATFAVPLIQLIPLPPVMWAALPGRDAYAEIYRLALMPPPWASLGLNPNGAWNAALALLPAAGAFLACLTLGSRSRLALLFVITTIAVIALLLGVAQVLDGRESALRFYETTNASAAVGFFSNRNHQASLQLAAMPMVTIVLMSWASSGVRSLPAVALGAGLFLLLATGTFLSESRAGVLLAPVVGVACLLLALHRTPLGLSRRTLLVSAVAAIVLTVIAGALVLRQMPDLAASVTTDIRAKALPVIAAEAVRQMPFGSGLGTFDDIYRTQERPETLTNAFLNHAHDDYLEIWLETGLVGVALIILFLVWFGRRAIELWSSRDPRYDVARGGTIVVGLLLVHSLVDYPLRTAAMSVVFGFACGLLFTPFGEPAGEQPASRPANDAALPRRSRQLTGRR